MLDPFFALILVIMINFHVPRNPPLDFIFWFLYIYHSDHHKHLQKIILTPPPYLRAFSRFRKWSGHRNPSPFKKLRGVIPCHFKSLYIFSQPRPMLKKWFSKLAFIRVYCLRASGVSAPNARIVLQCLGWLKTFLDFGPLNRKTAEVMTQKRQKNDERKITDRYRLICHFLSGLGFLWEGGGCLWWSKKNSRI